MNRYRNTTYNGVLKAIIIALKIDLGIKRIRH